jgi:hypothetical protein
MGEIIIKVPGDVRKVIELDLPYTEVLKRLGIRKEEEEIEFWTEEELKELGKKIHTPTLLNLDDEDYSQW